MTMMKRLAALVLALAMLLTLAACGVTNADSNTADEPKNNAAADAADPAPTEETPESTGSKVLVAYFSATGHRNICKQRWMPTSTRSFPRSLTPTPIWTITPTAAGPIRSKRTPRPGPGSRASRWTCPSMAPSIWAIPSGRAPHHGSSTRSWTAMT